MSKKTLQRVAVIILIAVLVVVPTLAFFAKESGSELAYEIPRMLGMEGLEENEVARLDGPPSTEVSGPIFETHGKAVSFNKDLRDLPQIGPRDKKPAREMGTPPNMGPNGNGVDSVLQGNIAQAAPAPGPSSNFKGLDLQNWGAGWPPDTHGDVGPDHYIQVVNTSIGVFDKASGSRLAAFTFDAFFQANGSTDACATLNYGDPVALYDQVSGRWIITDFAFAGSGSTPPYYECIAVSKSADPVSGGWWLYTVVADTQSLNDYPKLGIWNDGIYMSANMFKRGRSYAGAKVWALNRADLISGAALRSVAFQLGNSYFSLLPANAKVDPPPAGTPEYFMSDYGSNTSMLLWNFHVDWGNPSASTFTGPTSFSVASFTRPSSRIPQKNSSETLDALGDRLMTWLQYSNIGGTESLWVSRTVVAGGSYGIRWMEVRGMSGTPSVFQQGTYAPDSNYRWMPSLAVNANGSMAVGYSVSSSGMYPAIRYAGRLASDSPGTLSQTETSLIEGTGSQSGGYNRWGDYSSMSVDPDGCTFWFTTEYYETTGSNWQTRIGSFQLPDCGGGGGPTDTAPTVSITSPSNGATVSGSSVSVTANAADDNGVMQVEFFVDGGSIGVDTTAPYEATWDTTAYNDGAHTVSATATDTIGQTGSNAVGVTVQNTIPSGTIHVSAIDMSYTKQGPNYTVSIQVTIVDENGSPVSGATVDLSLDVPSSGTATGSATTGSNGTVTFSLKSRNTGSYVATVTNVSHSSYTYNPGANVETSDSLQVP
jgi:hypothetical protein